MKSLKISNAIIKIFLDFVGVHERLRDARVVDRDGDH